MKVAPRKRNFERVGSVRVPWYRATDGRTFVDPRRYGRKIAAFRDHDEAVREARRIAIEIGQGGTEVLALTAADRAVYAQASAVAAAYDRDLLGALGEWKTAHELLAAEPGEVRHTIDAAVRAGLAALRRPLHPTADIRAAFLTSLAGKDYDGRTARDLRNITRDFATAYPGDFAGISPEQIERFLAGRLNRDGSPLSAKRRNHIHAIIIAMFKFARGREVLPDVITAAAKVPRAEAQRAPIGFFTPAEMIVYLKHIEAEWLPWPLLVGFGACRVEEVALGPHAARRKDCLRWEDFDWEEREIVMRPEVAKVGRPRRIPILDNLYACLTFWRGSQATGPVVPGGDRRAQLERYRERFRNALRNLAEGGLEEITPRILTPPTNALRHSYGSYRMASVKNVNQVSDEMGDSPAMIRRHYDNPRPKTQARAWWNIYPADFARVSQLIFPFPRAA